MRTQGSSESADAPKDITSDRERHLLRILAEAVVRPSFKRCCESGPAIFDTFYANLSDQLPGVGSMFAHTDMQRQNALIRDGIAALIDYAAGEQTARTELGRLGMFHNRAHLNVEPEMYSGWITALMQMVAEYDAQRTDDVEAAWRAVLAPGIRLMTSMY